jgi:Putative mono-oxygenase ydhR
MTSSIQSVYVLIETQAREWIVRLAKIALDNERKKIMGQLSKTALLFRFPFSGPWGEQLSEASLELAHDIAGEDGLVWKIWLENRETGHAGGIYLFEDAVTAQRYREKHESRLLAMGLTAVTANAYAVNTELSVLTMAGAAVRQVRASRSSSTARVAAPAGQ